MKSSQLATHENSLGFEGASNRLRISGQTKTQYDNYLHMKRLALPVFL